MFQNKFKWNCKNRTCVILSICKSMVNRWQYLINPQLVLMHTFYFNRCVLTQLLNYHVINCERPRVPRESWEVHSNARALPAESVRPNAKIAERFFSSSTVEKIHLNIFARRSSWIINEDIAIFNFNWPFVVYVQTSARVRGTAWLHFHWLCIYNIHIKAPSQLSRKNYSLQSPSAALFVVYFVL